ncbi:MAG: DUF4097 family beta strand repeat protein [Lachnospiraceae bacterium]|nr:DUF4097 family beta strand repeat protein [Lachnospiraceae bacterium]
MKKNRIRLIAVGMLLLCCSVSLSGCKKVTSQVKSITSGVKQTLKGKESVEEEQELKKFNKVSVDLMSADVNIEWGDGYSIEITRTADYPIEAEVSKKTLLIHSDNSAPKNNLSATLNITVPKKASLTSVDVDVAAGDFSVRDISVDKISLKPAAGDCTIEGCQIQELDVDGNVSDVLVKDSVSIKDTSLSLATDVGTIKVGGKERKSPYKKKDGKNFIKVDVSVGDITIK